MPQNIFKIYDGRASFWQWDTGQKLIVLDESVNQVHFSNKNMTHSIVKEVYEKDGVRLCNVPDLILQMPKNLIAYAYSVDGNISRTVKSVKFAVIQRPIPDDYVCNQEEQLDDINRRLELLEAMLKDIELGNQEFNKFNTIEEAEQWAQENKSPGTIIVIHIDGKWIAHIVEDDYSVTPICDCNGQMVEVKLYDGGDSDGHEDATEVQIWDGGGAAGI